jgi:hypothetical protein
MKIIIIPESNEETRKHKENSYPDMEFVKKPLDIMRKNGIKNICVM